MFLSNLALKTLARSCFSLKEKLISCYFTNEEESNIITGKMQD
jgi:hypothetical protein